MRRGFTIHHNGPPANCLGQPHSRCVAFWESVVRYHTEVKGWSGVAYSWGVCPCGVRFEGQGWDRRQFANGDDMVGADDGDDSDWYTVLVFVGGDDSTNDTEPPTAEMVQATAALIGEGRASGRCGTRVLPHNAFKRKPCPGPEFSDLAVLWDDATLIIPPPYANTPPPPEEQLMRIIDCPGKPALILGVGGVKRLSTAQRNALRAAGVEAKRVDAATSDTLWSLKDDTRIDVIALAAELKPALADVAPGTLTEQDVEDAVSEALGRAFAAAAVAADG